jgi:restriction endonuclease
VETKNTGTGTVIEDLLKASEQDKIACGRKHFEAIGSGASYVVASSYDTLLDQVSIIIR